MSSGFAVSARSLALMATLAFAAPALAQQYGGEVDPEIRIQQLEDRLRTLTGQNEELQYRNRRLEEQVRQLQSGAGAPGAQQPAPNQAATPPAAPQQPYSQPAQQPAYGQQQPGYGQPQAPMVQPQPAVPQGGGRRGDAFDPSRDPNAPGVPRALGGGQLPMEQSGGMPAGRAAGAPMDLSNGNGGYVQGGYPQGGAPSAAKQPPAAAAGGALTTQPPSQTPRDEFDLGIGYMQRRDYALAEETMRNFAQKYPDNPLTADAQYWLGESFFQRQMYRDAAEAFLAVTSKHEKSGKAPDALLRLGQSLSALKEKEAACAALGEIGRKYPQASSSVKKAVDREQKKLKC
ncbi:tol-pal system protein YbgF [Rhodopseudomonas palustris]|uniref:tol-pal system protein YbgF n=1 Tax=Rhodopseudomonas palustris TaxID=1076 RepID=UPI000E5BFB76|nr:tol-pal system protein YbgF [Rhodopseudomonas palustris]QLH73820.1 tol-pal system protein YbgF [Rhodopseudomonas palustris]RHZ90614.1 tol-pal system protein YbgF [Rhodopseudomonas palustris]